MVNTDADTLRLHELHGAVLTVEQGGERKVLTGFACDDYPDCETCGHLDEEHAHTDESDGSDTGIQSNDDGGWTGLGSGL